MRGGRKLRLWIDAAVAAVFLGALFCVGAATLVTDGGNIAAAFAGRGGAREFLDEPAEASAWDWFAARVRSLDAYLRDHIFWGEELNHLNAAVQAAMGKRVIQSGEHPLMILEGGQLYEPQLERRSMLPAARELLSLRESLGAGVPLLFCYAHPGVYEESQYPPGYADLDCADEMADELLSLLSEGNLPVLDSREVLRASGLSPAEYLLRTDSHWATRAALEMAKAAAGAISRLTGAPLQRSRLEIGNFEVSVYRGRFLGSYGQRVGANLAPPDDIAVYWPRYRTNIRRRTEYLGESTDVAGEFRESVIRWRYLRVPEGQDWNTVAYFDYGLTEDWDYYRNADAADCCVLLLKDSFSAAMGGFLALVADEVFAVDLRRAEESVREWVERLRPDVVVAAYSLPFLLGEGVEG